MVVYKNRTTQGSSSSKKKSRHIYFMVDNIMHAISKLRYLWSHVVLKIPCILLVYGANIEIRPCVKWSLARG